MIVKFEKQINNMEQLRIKITKCNNQSLWYSQGVGQEVDCISISETGNAYIHSDHVDRLDGTNEGCNGFVDFGDYELLETKPIKKDLFDGCIKLKRIENGKLLPCMPDGQLIPKVAKGSLSIADDPELFKAGAVRIKFECFMKISDIDGIEFDEFKHQIEG